MNILYTFEHIKAEIYINSDTHLLLPKSTEL